MFDFEWTGRAEGGEAERSRGIEAAKRYCSLHNADPARAYQDFLTAIDEGRDPPGGPASWYQIAWAAEQAYCENWERAPENFSLVWR